MVNGWVEACANGRVREREREREIGTEMVSSTVMYNFGGGPRFSYVSSSDHHAKS